MSARAASFLFALLAFFACGTASAASLIVPHIFGDHMVLQAGQPMPLWGWDKPGERVTVRFAGQEKQANAAPDGRWEVRLEPVNSSAEPRELTVAGSETLTFKDVLVGEVWLCSGQSNMELPLAKAADGKAAVAGATDNSIRLCRVPWDMAIAPREDVRSDLAGGDLWQVCTPQNAGTFSAVGYFFGHDIRARLKRPVGLIESCWGGTPCQAWTDLKTLQSDPGLHYAKAFETFAAGFPGGDAEFIQKLTADRKPGARPGASYVRRGYGPHLPTSLFDAMINPIIPFRIKGVIWYQGEDNADNEAKGAGMEYRTLFPAMINDWRGLWKEGDFPFLYVQLANLADRPKAHWAVVRESQLKTLSLPSTGMAVTIDIGAIHNIHPPDKADVGHRLSLLARNIAYGENVVCSGPLYDSMTLEGNKIRIAFKPSSIGVGLTIGKPPWTDPKAPPLSSTQLQGFTIAGEDRKWMEAQAVIDGTSLIVSNAGISKPAAVRYAWGDSPTCNLYNKDGLPASPFRTDNWEVPPAETANK